MADPAFKTEMPEPAARPVDPVLKVVAPPRPQVSTRARKLLGVFKQYRRVFLLVVVPAIAAVVALTVFLMGGRYITTDNAYVGTQKVLVTPDIAGKVNRVMIVEGQRVRAGEVLVQIDPVPFEIAVRQAEGRVATVRTELSGLKANLASLEQLIDIGRETLKLKQNDVDRKSALLASRSGSAADADTALNSLAAARAQLEQLTQQQTQIRTRLLDDPDLPIEKYPAYVTAAAALDQAKRDLDHATIRAPISGMATQVDSIQLGRYVTAGTPLFAILDDQHPWVDANPKETDITFLKLGQKAYVYVDTFPGHRFEGTVTAISPGTGSQFAILPPQNASGNWVKVVQRVPVRVLLDPGQHASLLRAGMSATVEVDTKRRRTFWSLFGDTNAVAERFQ
jgi:membrane fusion protein (multidrug efflux system)